MGSGDSSCTTKFGISNYAQGLNPFRKKLSNGCQPTHMAINFKLALLVQLQAHLAQQLSKGGLSSFAPLEGARHLAQEMPNCRQSWPRACEAYSLEGAHGHWAAPSEIERSRLAQLPRNGTRVVKDVTHLGAVGAEQFDVLAPQAPEHLTIWRHNGRTI
jgi:hypothetical protein